MAFNVDVQDLIDDFRVDGGIQIERRFEDTLDSVGEAIPQPLVQFIELRQVAVWPAGGRDLLQLAEADRRKETIGIASNVQLFTSGEQGFQADIIRYDLKKWKVVKVRDYQRQGGVFVCLANLAEAAA